MRHYFHVDAGSPKRDAEGLEFPNDRAAQQQATHACAELLHDIDGALKPGDDLLMEVRDQTGRLCFTLGINTSGKVRQVNHSLRVVSLALHPETLTFAVGRRSV